MPQIVPISHLKNTSEISEMCHSAREPMCMTKNGYGDMVLMSMENYERMVRMAKIYEELEESERQVEAGQAVGPFAGRRRLGVGRHVEGREMCIRDRASTGPHPGPTRAWT